MAIKAGTVDIASNKGDKRWPWTDGCKIDFLRRVLQFVIGLLQLRLCYCLG